MNLKKCAQGHFYDADKEPVCPQCRAAAASEPHNVPNAPVASSSDVTMAVKPQSDQEHTQKVSPTGDTMRLEPQNGGLISQVEEIRTVGIMTNKPSSKAPVAGWLVCVDGKHYGEDFRITEGKNFIGRGNAMDIVLAKDVSVSREKHAIIIYEPKENIFLLSGGESKALCYINGQVVLSMQMLKAGDIIQLGHSKLMFVPLCGESFKWKAAKQDEE